MLKSIDRVEISTYIQKHHFRLMIPNSQNPNPFDRTAPAYDGFGFCVFWSGI
jgi:hypothetical protein